MHKLISPKHLFSGLNEKLDLEFQTSISIRVHWWLKVRFLLFLKDLF